MTGSDTARDSGKKIYRVLWPGYSGIGEAAELLLLLLLLLTGI
jgi:hypothetical protein